MISVERIMIKGIPALHIFQGENQYKQLPLVIFIHGFTSAKEHNLHYAYLLANRGIRVVLPETILHGERQIAAKESDIAFHFWEIVLTTIAELRVVKEFFEEQDLIDVNRIGLAGTSMGGIITLGALTQYEWIHTAVSLMGAPSYESFARGQIAEMKKRGIQLPISVKEQERLLLRLRQFDLSVHPEKLADRSLFFWHGKMDSVVPFEYSYKFYETIKGNNNKVQFLADDKAGHQVTREGLLKTVEWFESSFKLQVITS